MKSKVPPLKQLILHRSVIPLFFFLQKAGAMNMDPHLKILLKLALLLGKDIRQTKTIEVINKLFQKPKKESYIACIHIQLYFSSG